ncbi:hypothetical protein Tco_1177980 [Tanacetum coccineum]
MVVVMECDAAVAAGGGKRRPMAESGVGDQVLKDSINMDIPLPEGTGFSKETVQVEYEWKPPRCEQCKIFSHIYDQCPKNATSIPTVDMTNDGFQMPIKQKIKFEPKAAGNTTKYGVSNVSTTSKGGPNNEHMVSKKRPSKVVDIPLSSKTSYTVNNGGTKFTTSSSTIPTSNPYDMLAQKFHLENYTRSGGDPI